ncbi:MAG: hypothetical protein ABI193_26600 [Minicystis sp.]
MIPDPIVEEARAARDEIAKECDYDIDTIFQRLRRAEAASPVPHVSLPPRRVDKGEQDDSTPIRGAA